MAVWPSEDNFTLICAFLMPHPLASHNYTTSSYLVERYYSYKDIWQWKSRLVVVQWDILSNRCLMLGCKLAIFPSLLPHVVFLASTYCTSHSLIIATRLMDTDRCPLGSGRSSESWKYWKNAIAWSLLPCLSIAHSKFHIAKISNVWITITPH